MAAVQMLAAGGECILVFVPGIGEISQLQDELEANNDHCAVELQVPLTGSPRSRLGRLTAVVCPGV